MPRVPRGSMSPESCGRPPDSWPVLWALVALPAAHRRGHCGDRTSAATRRSGEPAMTSPMPTAAWCGRRRYQPSRAGRRTPAASSRRRTRCPGSPPVHPPGRRSGTSRSIGPRQPVDIQWKTATQQRSRTTPNLFTRQPHCRAVRSVGGNDVDCQLIGGSVLVSLTAHRGGSLHGGPEQAGLSARPVLLHGTPGMPELFTS